MLLNIFFFFYRLKKNKKFLYNILCFIYKIMIIFVFLFIYLFIQVFCLESTQT
jgi:hypothetical protein